METFRPEFDWKIGDRVHVLQKSEKGVVVALNGTTHILSINHPIGRHLHAWPIDIMLIIVDKRRITYNHEGKLALPWSDDCVGETYIPVYVKISL